VARTITPDTTATEIVDVCLDELVRLWAEYHDVRSEYVTAMKSRRGMAEADANYIYIRDKFKEAHREYKTAIRNIIKNHQL